VRGGVGSLLLGHHPGVPRLHGLGLSRQPVLAGPLRSRPGARLGRLGRHPSRLGAGRRGLRRVRLRLGRVGQLLRGRRVLLCVEAPLHRLPFVGLGPGLRVLRVVRRDRRVDGVRCRLGRSHCRRGGLVHPLHDQRPFRPVRETRVDERAGSGLGGDGGGLGPLRRLVRGGQLVGRGGLRRGELRGLGRRGAGQDAFGRAGCVRRAGHRVRRALELADGVAVGDQQLAAGFRRAGGALGQVGQVLGGLGAGFQVGQILLAGGGVRGRRGQISTVPERRDGRVVAGQGGSGGAFHRRFGGCGGDQQGEPVAQHLATVGLGGRGGGVPATGDVRAVGQEQRPVGVGAPQDPVDLGVEVAARHPRAGQRLDGGGVPPGGVRVALVGLVLQALLGLVEELHDRAGLVGRQRLGGGVPDGGFRVEFSGIRDELAQPRVGGEMHPGAAVPLLGDQWRHRDGRQVADSRRAGLGRSGRGCDQEPGRQQQGYQGAFHAAPPGVDVRSSPARASAYSASQ
jgi:hypothetical protein